MDGIDESAAFVERVVQMRKAQKDYFRTRRYEALRLAKELEKDVDDRAERLVRQMKNDERERLAAAQPDLFGDASANA